MAQDYVHVYGVNVAFYWTWGGLHTYEYGSFGYYLFWLIESICMVSVNAFVLITGYYGIKSRFKLSRIIRFYLEVVFFSMVCTIIAKLFSGGAVGMKEWAYAIMPLTSKRYWFASNYALLLFIQPMINLFIKNIDKKTYRRFILIQLLLFSLIPTFLIWNREFAGTGMDIIWFLILYFTGAYVHHYGLSFKGNRWFLLYILFVSLLYVSDVVIIPGLAKAVIGVSIGIGVFNYYNTIFVFLGSICFFMMFVQTEENRLIENSRGMVLFTGIGTYAFGAYLISDHRVIRNILWEKINIVGISENPIVVLLYMISVNIVIFLIGVILDWIIKHLISNKSLEKIFTKIDGKMNSIIN